MNALQWLAAVSILTTVMWVPHVVRRMLVLGIWPTFDNPKSGTEPTSGWAKRSAAAHNNAIANLAVFGPLVVAAQLAGHGPAIVGLAQIYFWARVGHYVLYTAGVPVGRTLAFFAGLVVQVMIAMQILG